MKLKRMLFFTLLALAALAATMLALGYEHEANIIAPMIFIPWGGLGVVEYFRGEPIQVTWYRVAAEASSGERLLHLLLSFLLLAAGLGAIIKNAV